MPYACTLLLHPLFFSRNYCNTVINDANKHKSANKCKLAGPSGYSQLIEETRDNPKFSFQPCNQGDKESDYNVICSSDCMNFFTNKLFTAFLEMYQVQIFLITADISLDSLSPILISKLDSTIPSYKYFFISMLVRPLSYKTIRSLTTN